MTSPLQVKLDELEAQFEGKAPPATLELMHRATAALAASGQADRAVPVGTKLPAFELKNQDGELVRSADLPEKGPLVVSFFRGGWCPYCKIELDALNEAHGAIRDLGAELVVITPQTTEKSAALKQEKGFSFDLLTDPGLAYADQLQIAFELPEELVALYNQFRLDLPEYNGD